ncbi:uncharacterized protein LOC110853665 [Folsomia candida]|uniref:uncharacterized protein LOC110853665 n=1 Tax=Folsomia candida TaxID=158441 RepID=UPI00160520F5|nr:uncharacterized protein LOC110853665 [Folsomia candida]
MVALKKLNGRKKHIIRAATVSIVDFDGKEIFSEMIFHEKGSFLVSKETISVNGFREDSLIGGIDMDKVRDKIISILDGKLVATCNGAADFNSLDIRGGDVDSLKYFSKMERNFQQNWSKKLSTFVAKENLSSLF